MKINKSYFEEFEMDLTGVCNLSCPLCSRNYVHAQHMVYKSVRPLDVIIKQLDTFPNLKRAFIAGQVSEPTLYPEFLDYLRYLKSRGIYIELFTNGSTRDEEFWYNVGLILDPTDKCVFTVCGSTQELHSKYRVGSSLKQILNNAEAYRKANKNNDYCQFIKFKYNSHDEFKTKELGFTKWFSVGSEGIRNENDKKVQHAEDVWPEDNRDKLIRSVFDLKPKGNEKPEIICKSLEDKKIYITQKGDVSACYVHYEYNPDHTFTEDVFDYSSILDFNFKDCWTCTKRCKFFIDKLNLDFVC